MAVKFKRKDTHAQDSDFVIGTFPRCHRRWHGGFYIKSKYFDFQIRLPMVYWPANRPFIKLGRTHRYGRITGWNFWIGPVAGAIANPLYPLPRHTCYPGVGKVYYPFGYKVLGIAPWGM